MSDIVELLDELACLFADGDEIRKSDARLLRDAMAEIERLRSLVEWRPIDDNTPHNTELLLYSPQWTWNTTGKMEVACASMGGRARLSDGTIASSISRHGGATHWLPLPPPPEPKP